MKKTLITTLIISCMAAGIIACSNNSSSLTGTYTSEDDQYSIKFKANNTCTWYQGEDFFNGTYEYEDNAYTLEIEGSGLYKNTIFTATKSDSGLIIDGGSCDDVLFIKE